MNLKKYLILIIIILVFFSIGSFFVYEKIQKNNKLELDAERQKLKEEISIHYNKYVKTNKDALIYRLINSKYVESGSIKDNQELSLDEMIITYDSEYFKINSFDEEYYIYYKDVDEIEELSVYSDRYKKYIAFNNNIITEDVTSFYDENDNLIYTFNKSFDLPIIINKKDIYGIEFNNRLLYVKKEDVKEVKHSDISEQSNVSGVAVLNYHFFFDETESSERLECTHSICISKSLFSNHLKYIKDNNVFSLTMNEFEMYINHEINLPKSVLITIDDGWRSELGVKLLEEYELNATVFLITSWFDEIKFLNDSSYVEYHSHGDKLHDQGVCPGGQGGAIKCLNRIKLLEDLALSRKKLNGSTAFCYPFYEYNGYSINILKEAGFTLAFAGGFKKATPNTDKFQIPRYVIYRNTSVEQLKTYIG